MKEIQIMKKILLVSFLFVFCFNTFAKDVTFYISPSGNDANPGTLERPFLTLEKAKNAILDRISENANFIIYFREGLYHFYNSVVFDENFSGTSVSLENYQGEQVVFSGSSRLAAEAFSPVTDKDMLKRLRPKARGNVLEFDLKAKGISYDSGLARTGFAHDIQPSSCILFFNKEYLRLARWPNEGKLPIGEVLDMGTNPRLEKGVPPRGAIFRYNYDRAKSWTKANDIWLYGVFSNGYSDDNLQVGYFNTKKNLLKTVQPHFFGVYSSADSSNWDVATSRHLRGYYVYNLVEELDMPGEYFLDRETGKLYLWPPSSIGNAEVELSQTTVPFLVLYNTANIAIRGISFECSRGMGIFMDRVSNITVDHCLFKNLGLMAVSIGEPYHSLELPRQNYLDKADKLVNRDNRIVNCTISNTGSGALHIEGGDRILLKAAGNLIDNCDISGYCRVSHTGVQGITVKGVSNTVSHCYIHDAPNTAVLFRGNNHLLEYNHLERVCTESSDAGAVYAGRNPSAQGTVIRYNFFDSIIQSENMVCAVYLDDGTSGYKIYSNVFYRCGNSGSFEGFGAFHINGGMENYITNNIFVGCKKAYGSSSWPDRKWIDYLTRVVGKRLDAVNIDSDIYRKAYPMLKTLRDTVDFPLRINYTANDLLYNCGEYSTGMWQHSNSLQMYKDPGFVDAVNKNFMLKENSVAFKMLPGFLPVPFEKIGLRKNEQE